MSFATSGRWRAEVSRTVLRAVFALLALALIGAASTLFTGCASVSSARRTAEGLHAVNRGHEGDPQLPHQAREIAQTNADVLEVIRWHLGGDEPSREAVERINARRVARGLAPLEVE